MTEPARTSIVMAVDNTQLNRFRAGTLARGPHQDRVDRLLRRLVRVGLRLLDWRVDATGLDRLPHDRGFLLVGAPHRAWVDPFLVIAAWPSSAPRLTWFGDGQTMIRSWWRRLLLPRLGMIPIDRRAGGPRAYADVVTSLIVRGGVVALFAEKGPPSSPTETRAISPGFAYLAMAAGAPVVPVAIAGTHHIVRGSSFCVDVLPPLDPGPRVGDPFGPDGRDRARATAATFRAAVTDVLATRTPWVDARRPARDRWPWLARLFR